MVSGYDRGGRPRSRATPAQSGRILTHKPEQQRRLSLPAARAAPPASSQPSPRLDPLPQLLSSELSPRSFVSVVEMLLVEANGPYLSRFQRSLYANLSASVPCGPTSHCRIIL